VSVLTHLASLFYDEEAAIGPSPHATVNAGKLPEQESRASTSLVAVNDAQFLDVVVEQSSDNDGEIEDDIEAHHQPPPLPATSPPTDSYRGTDPVFDSSFLVIRFVCKLL